MAGWGWTVDRGLWWGMLWLGSGARRRCGGGEVLRQIEVFTVEAYLNPALYSFKWGPICVHVREAGVDDGLDDFLAVAREGGDRKDVRLLIDWTPKCIVGQARDGGLEPELDALLKNISELKSRLPWK